MENEAWPTPQSASREPLPRVEDLPVAEQGYDQESVRAAFDSFYRHAAQLDAALRTLEAVDSFHRHASALRSDLRALRSAGWTQQTWSSGPSYGYEMRSTREGVSPVVWRVLGEVVFLIAVAVGLGLASLSWWTILLAMAGALAIVCAIEWAAGREDSTYALPPVAQPQPPHPVVDVQRNDDTEEHDALGWTAFEEAQEPSDAMTIIGAPPAEEAEAEAEGEAEAEAQPRRDPDPEDGPEPRLTPAAAEPAAAEETRRRWWRRGSTDEEAVAAEPVVDAPRHVRVIPPEQSDPWEQGFDEPVSAEAEEVGPDEPELSEEGGRKLFRRR